MPLLSEGPLKNMYISLNECTTAQVSLHNNTVLKITFTRLLQVIVPRIRKVGMSYILFTIVNTV